MKLKNTISESKTINRSIDWLFNFTQNFDNRKIWDEQTIEISFIHDCIELKKGAKVKTKSKEGICMETEYLTFDKPNKISIKMLNKSSIFKDFIGSWDYTPIGHTKTDLKITYSFNLKFPYSLIQRKVLQKVRINMTKKLNSLEKHLIKTENNQRQNIA